MPETPTEASLTATMRGLELYVIETAPARSPETLAVLPAHLAYQVELERRGVLFLAGPVTEEGAEAPSAGMIVIRAKDFEEARAFADADPFHARGLRQYRIRRWRINEGALRAEIRLSDQSVEFS